MTKVRVPNVVTIRRFHCTPLTFLHRPVMSGMFLWGGILILSLIENLQIYALDFLLCVFLLGGLYVLPQVPTFVPGAACASQPVILCVPVYSMHLPYIISRSSTLILPVRYHCLFQVPYILPQSSLYLNTVMSVSELPFPRLTFFPQNLHYRKRLLGRFYLNRKQYSLFMPAL